MKIPIVGASFPKVSPVLSAISLPRKKHSMYGTRISTPGQESSANNEILVYFSSTYTAPRSLRSACPRFTARVLGWQEVDPNLRSEIRCLSLAVKGGMETNAASCFHGCISKSVGKFLNDVLDDDPAIAVEREERRKAHLRRVGIQPGLLEFSSYPMQDVLFDFDLVKIFVMRLEKPRASRHCAHHVCAEGTQRTVHTKVS
jgi:hypothetical protein